MTATAQFDLTLRRLDHKATRAKNCAERATPVLLRAPGPRLVQVELLASSNPESDRSGAEEQKRCPVPGAPDVTGAGTQALCLRSGRFIFGYLLASEEGEKLPKEGIRKGRFDPLSNRSNCAEALDHGWRGLSAPPCRDPRGRPPRRRRLRALQARSGPRAPRLGGWLQRGACVHWAPKNAASY